MLQARSTDDTAYKAAIVKRRTPLFLRAVPELASHGVLNAATRDMAVQSVTCVERALTRRADGLRSFGEEIV